MLPRTNPLTVTQTTSLGLMLWLTTALVTAVWLTEGQSLSTANQRYLEPNEVGSNLGPYQLTTFSLIICILESKPCEEKQVHSVHPSSPEWSAGYVAMWPWRIHQAFTEGFLLFICR